MPIAPNKTDKQAPPEEEPIDAQREQRRIELRRKHDLLVTGKLKPPQTRNLPRLKQILKDEGFRFSGNRLTISRMEATFEIDLKMGHVSVLREGQEPLALCVTLESSPWANNEDLTDFDLFLLSVVYLLAHEPLPKSITQQLDSVST